MRKSERKRRRQQNNSVSFRIGENGEILVLRNVQCSYIALKHCTDTIE